MSSLDISPRPDTIPKNADKFRTQMGQISRHSGVFFLGTMFTAAAGYLFKVYLARKLGAEALGLYALGMSIIGFLGVFNALGLPQSAVRFIALYIANGKYDELRGFFVRALGLLLTANLVLGVVVIIGGPWVAQRFYHAPELKRYFGLFAFIMALGALTAFFGQVLQGFKDVSRRTVITNFIGTPLMMLFTIALVSMGGGLRGYLQAQVASAVVVSALLLLAIWRLSPQQTRRWSGSYPQLGSHVLSFGGAVFGMAVMEFLLAQVDKILIGVYINAREVGIYSVAMAIVAFVPVALQSVNQIFSPTIADLHSRGEHQLLGELFQTLTKWILALTLPLATVVAVFSKPLMRLFGQDFESGWVVLAVGTVGQLVNCATGSVGYLLLMSGNQKRLLKVQFIMTLLVLVLNVVLIPYFGILGAALATAIITILSNLCYLREVRSALEISPYNRGYLRLVPAILGSTAVVVILRQLTSAIMPQWPFMIASTLLSYLILASISLSTGLDERDRVIARAIWMRMRGMFAPMVSV